MGGEQKVVCIKGEFMMCPVLGTKRHLLNVRTGFWPVWYNVKETGLYCKNKGSSEIKRWTL